MSDDNKELSLLVGELVIKVGALEKLLVKKQIFTSEEYLQEVKDISNNVIEFLKNKFTNGNN